MGDTDVGGPWFYLDDVKYMATLFLVDDPDDVVSVLNFYFNYMVEEQ